MKTHFTVTKKEEMNMNCFLCCNSNFLQAIFKHMPERVARHSKRVSELAGIMAGYVPEKYIPDGLTRDSYRSALICGGYYHDIGVYLARNALQNRPAASERLLLENRFKNWQSVYSDVVIETVRHCHNWYLSGTCTDIKAMPFHASICAVADAADMIISRNRFCRKNADKALKYIRKNSGILFHPEAVSYFEKAKKDNFSVCKQNVEVVTVAGNNPILRKVSK